MQRCAGNKVSRILALYWLYANGSVLALCTMLTTLCQRTHTHTHTHTHTFTHTHTHTHTRYNFDAVCIRATNPHVGRVSMGKCKCKAKHATLQLTSSVRSSDPCWRWCTYWVERFAVTPAPGTAPALSDHQIKAISPHTYGLIRTGVTVRDHRKWSIHP